MRFGRRVWLAAATTAMVLVNSLVWAAGADGQTTGASSSATSRVMLRGLAGMTFGGGDAGRALGIGAGVRVNPRFVVFGETGHLTNIMTQDVLNAFLQNFNDKDLLPSNFFGPTDVRTFTATESGNYLFGGGRVNLLTRGSSTAFVEAGFGFTRISLHPTASVNGVDRTAELVADWTKGKLIVTVNKKSYLLTAGYSRALTAHASLDVAFRFVGLPLGNSLSLNSNTLYTAFSWWL